jgi:type III restriction enzyme
VTHLIGLRPFMSQLLCEQVVGRGLRRRNYEVGDDGLLNEEVAQVLGVPFEVIPFKATKAGTGQPTAKRHHVHPVPSKAAFEVRFPRVEGYTQKVRNRVMVDWPAVPALVLEPGRIPPEVEVKALSVNNEGRMTLTGPGRIDEVKLNEFRARHRLQQLVFDVAHALTQEMCATATACRRTPCSRSWHRSSTATCPTRCWRSPRRTKRTCSCRPTTAG